MILVGNGEVGYRGYYKGPFMGMHSSGSGVLFPVWDLGVWLQVLFGFVGTVVFTKSTILLLFRVYTIAMKQLPS